MEVHIGSGVDRPHQMAVPDTPGIGEGGVNGTPLEAWQGTIIGKGDGYLVQMMLVNASTH